MNFDLPQLWAMEPSHFAGLLSIREALMRGAAVTSAELEDLLGDPSPTLTRRGRVAVIPLRGVLTGKPLFGLRIGGLSRFEAMMREASRRPDIESILIDADTPGGTVSGMTEAAAVVRDVAKGKKVVASINALAAAGAYQILAQANQVTITPSGAVGGLGVMATHVDASESLVKEGIVPTVVASPPAKAEASGLSPLSDAGRKNLQRLVDDSYSMMVKDISRGRRVGQRKVREGFGEGRLLTARDALARRMVDRIEDFDATLARVAGVPMPKARLSDRARAELARIELSSLEVQGRQREELHAELERRYSPAAVMRELAELEA